MARYDYLKKFASYNKKLSSLKELVLCKKIEYLLSLEGEMSLKLHKRFLELEIDYRMAYLSSSHPFNFEMDIFNNKAIHHLIGKLNKDIN